jgi:hypothetical protein
LTFLRSWITVSDQFFGAEIRCRYLPAFAVLSSVSVTPVRCGRWSPIGISAALEISRLVAIPLVAPRIPGVQVLR